MKKISLFLLIPLLLPAFLSPVFAAAPVKARPLSGIGVLVMQSRLPGSLGQIRKLQLYKEPMLGRLAPLPVDRLPKLAPYIASAEGVAYAIVISLRPGWLRLLYDDAERGGWVERRKAGEFLKWEQFLAGRAITMLPGIRQEYCQLRSEPSPASPPLATIGKNEPVTVVRVGEYWVQVSRGDSLTGWLRWRDDNGRLLVAINSQIPPLKR